MIGDFFGGSSSQSSFIRTFTYANLPFRAVNETGATFDMFVFRPGVGDVAFAGTVPGFSAVPPPGAAIVAVNDAAGGPGGVGFQGANPDVPPGGTFLGGQIVQTFDSQLESLYSAAFRVQYLIDIPNPGAGGAVGRLKIADNTSPMPRDRLIFDYSFFRSVPLWPGGVDVNRFVLGFEKTFLDELMSFELKAPMAVTLDSAIVADGVTDTTNEEFGNLALTFKGLLLRRQAWAMSAGLTIGAPTADDVRVFLADGTQLVNISNQAVHVMPFVGLLWTPNDRLFAQGFLQYDVDANGCPVGVNSRGTGLLPSGRINDATYQYLDLGIGYWTHRAQGRGDFLTGLAWTAELHWNQSLSDTDFVARDNFIVGNLARDVSVWDLTLGCHAELNRRTMVTAAYCTPLGGGLDRQFDGEFRLMLNHQFGRASRANRAPPSL